MTIQTQVTATAGTSAAMAHATTGLRLHAANLAMNDIIADALVKRAVEQGSTAPGMIFKHHADVTAKAVFPDLKRSCADEIATRPEVDQAILAAVRHGLAARLPGWEQEDRSAGLAKTYKQTKRAKAWCAAEVAELRALPPADVFSRVAVEIPLIEGPANG